MNTDKDRDALEAWIQKNLFSFERPGFSMREWTVLNNLWQAALEYARQQPPLKAPSKLEPDEEPSQEALDAFIKRAGFPWGWESLTTAARRMAKHALREQESSLLHAIHVVREACAEAHVAAGGSVLQADCIRALSDQDLLARVKGEV